MKTLLMTTAIVTALAGIPAFAQTAPAADQGVVGETGTVTQSGAWPDPTVPEGYARDDMALTVDQLLGATIYDATGDSIGNIHDLVIGATSAPATTAATAPSTGMTDAGTTSGAATGMDAGTATTDTTGGAAVTDSAAGMAPEGSTNTEAVTGGTGAATMTEADIAANAAAGTEAGAEGSSTGMDTGAAGNTDTVADGTAATGAATGVESATGMGASTTAGAATMETDGQITHAILDIGGFLGIGQHRVAVPVSDLAIYRSGSDTRVYLPWSRDQLDAQPAYDENDPASLGQSLMPRQE